MPLAFRPSAVSPRLPLVLLSVALLSACASSGPPAPDLDERLLGVWTDEGGATITISPGADGYEIGVVDDDGEVFDMESVTYEAGVLAWTYFVPSTGYRVVHETTVITPDRLEVRWENQTGASGTDVLQRVD